MRKAFVIGAGPAGLMAAERLALAGQKVVLVDWKPSVARKFLMAGKSGLNLTKDEPIEAFSSAYGSAKDWLEPMLRAFGPEQVKAFAEGLDQEVFTGTSGRVFPKRMKASPLLRAWLSRLDGLAVELRTKWRWTGWDGDALAFVTPDGQVSEQASVTILALGGGSWRRLGSDGVWTETLRDIGVEVAPFLPSNAAASVDWSTHMAAHFGTPIKAIELGSGDMRSRGEIILSADGIEGSGIYGVTPRLREGHPLVIDLLPNLSEAQIAEKLAATKPSDSVSNRLRKALKLPKGKQAMLQECARPLPSAPAELATVVKSLTVSGATPGPLDKAISTAGGVSREAVTDDLMLKARPGVFVAGEMLDWDAPTGGYLITACLATGAWAGEAAASWAQTSRMS